MVLPPRLRALLGLFTLGTLLSAQTAPPPAREVLTYEAEWRLIRAGTAEVTWTGDSQAELKIVTAGLVDRLYRIEDNLKSQYAPGFCITGSVMDAQEGKRHRDIKVTYDRTKKRASYLERDVLADKVTAQKEIDIPACVHDVLGALHVLRTKRVEPGQSITFPVSDGKKLVSAKVEAQERETVKTPAGTFQTTRYEAFLFNGVLYGRKGRLFIWISDDDRHLPVQIRVQLPFYIGTVTLQLEKIEH
jgi:hypothetical protein